MVTYARAQIDGACAKYTTGGSSKAACSTGSVASLTEYSDDDCTQETGTSSVTLDECNVTPNWMAQENAENDIFTNNIGQYTNMLAYGQMVFLVPTSDAVSSPTAACTTDEKNRGFAYAFVYFFALVLVVYALDVLSIGDGMMEAISDSCYKEYVREKLAAQAFAKEKEKQPETKEEAQVRRAAQQTVLLYKAGCGCSGNKSKPDKVVQAEALLLAPQLAERVRMRRLRDEVIEDETVEAEWAARLATRPARGARNTWAQKLLPFLYEDFSNTYDLKFFHRLQSSCVYFGSEGVVWPDGLVIPFSSARLPVGMAEDFLFCLANYNVMAQLFLATKGHPFTRFGRKTAFFFMSSMAFVLALLADVQFKENSIFFQIGVLSPLTLIGTKYFYFLQTYDGIFAALFYFSISLLFSVLHSSVPVILSLLSLTQQSFPIPSHRLSRCICCLPGENSTRAKDGCCAKTVSCCVKTGTVVATVSSACAIGILYAGATQIPRENCEKTVTTSLLTYFLTVTLTGVVVDTCNLLLFFTGRRAFELVYYQETRFKSNCPRSYSWCCLFFSLYTLYLMVSGTDLRFRCGQWFDELCACNRLDQEIDASAGEAGADVEEGGKSAADSGALQIQSQGLIADSNDTEGDPEYQFRERVVGPFIGCFMESRIRTLTEPTLAAVLERQQRRAALASRIASNVAKAAAAAADDDDDAMPASADEAAEKETKESAPASAPERSKGKVQKDERKEVRADIAADDVGDSSDTEYGDECDSDGSDTEGGGKGEGDADPDNSDSEEDDRRAVAPDAIRAEGSPRRVKGARGKRGKNATLAPPDASTSVAPAPELSYGLVVVGSIFTLPVQAAQAILLCGGAPSVSQAEPDFFPAAPPAPPAPREPVPGAAPTSAPSDVDQKKKRRKGKAV